MLICKYVEHFERLHYIMQTTNLVASWTRICGQCIVWLHKWIQLYSNVRRCSDYDFESLTPINGVDFNISMQF